MIDNIENAAAELLERLYDSDVVMTESPISALKFSWGTGSVDEYVVAQYAAGRGLISHTKHSNGESTAALLPNGIAYVQRLRRNQCDPQQLTTAMRRLILRWLYENSALYIVTWDELELEPGSNYLGRRFTSDEIGREARHLHDLGLIEAQDMGDEYGIQQVVLTEQGLSCVTNFGGDVAKSIRDGGHGNVTTNNIYMPDNNGNLAVNSSGFTQKIISGIDTTDLLKFAGAVRQILPTLDLPANQADTLRQESAELHEAASQTEPDVGLLRRLGRSILTALGTAAPTVASDLVLQLGEHAVKAISGG